MIASIKWWLSGITLVISLSVFSFWGWHVMRGSVSQGSELLPFTPGGIAGITDYKFFRDPFKCVGEGFIEKERFKKWLAEAENKFTVRNTSEENPVLFQRYVSFKHDVNDSILFFKSIDGVYCSNLDESGEGTTLLFDNQSSKIYFFISSH